jgi:hypothetical protein
MITKKLLRKNFYLPENTWEKLQEIATNRQLSVSEIIREILHKHFNGIK